MQRVATLLLILLLPAFLVPEGTTICLCDLSRAGAPTKTKSCCMSCCESTRIPATPIVRTERPSCCCVAPTPAMPAAHADRVQPLSNTGHEALALPIAVAATHHLLTAATPLARDVIDLSTRTVPRTLTLPLRL